MAQLLSSIQPPPFRVPLLDDQGQLVETWARFFLAAQAAIVQILAAKPLALIGSIPPPLDDASGLVDDFAGISAPVTGRISGGAFTQGSVIFAGSGGILSQDNAKFFWDDTNFRLGIGTAVPSASLVVAGDSALLIPISLRLQGASSVNSQELDLGYNTTSDYGSIQAIHQGVAYKSLCLNIGGGAVGVATTTPETWGLFSVRGSLSIGGTNTSASFSDTVNSTFDIRHAAGVVNLSAETVAMSFSADSAERMRLKDGLSIGDTIDPGATNFRVAGLANVLGKMGVGFGTVPSWPFSLTSTFTDIGSLVLGPNDFSCFNVSGIHASTTGMGIAGLLQTTISSGTQAAVAGLVIFDTTGAGAVTSQAGILIRGQGKGTNNSAIVIGTDTIPSGNLGVYVATGIANAFLGSVGVGTTTPTTWGSLAVRTFVSIGGVNVSASFSDATLTTFDIRHKTGVVDLSAQGDALTFSAGSAERMRVKTGVSIGDTTDPGATNFRVAGTTALVKTITRYNNIATVGGGVPALYGLDSRTGLTVADGAPITLYTTVAANGLFEIWADLFATAAVTGTATYTIAWTENATAQTMVVTATAINVPGASGTVIRPDNATAITAQLTGVFTGTFDVAGVVKQIA